MGGGGLSVCLAGLLLAGLSAGLFVGAASAAGYRAAWQDFTLDYDSRMSGNEYRQVFTRTLGGCARLCRPLAVCRAFSYNRFSGGCALIGQLSRARARSFYVTGVKVASVVTQVDSGRVSAMAVSDPQLVAPRQIAGMQLEYGVERIGSGYRHMPQQHAEDCARACGELQSCVSFRYVPHGRQCALFNTLVDSRPRLGVVSGFRVAGGQGGRQWELAGFALHQDVVLAGQDYRHQTAAELAGCVALCGADPQCQAFSFDAANGRCALKQTVPPRRYRKGLISGVRQRR